jgi:structure-specific endonuclease subunit SLX1
MTLQYYYCYLISSKSSPNYTYIGITNNLPRRLRQHNKEIKGGAKATRRYTDWEFIKTVEMENKSKAMSLEWKWKHRQTKSGKWIRSKSGIQNKLDRLNELL